MKETMEKLGYIKLYLRCADKFIETGKTPLSNSGRPLSKINPLGHLNKDIRLPVFSQLYHEYRETSASFMLPAFFMGHLFNEINNGGLERDEVTVCMLNELLVSSSARAHIFVEILEFSIKLIKRVVTENSIIIKVKVTD